MEELSKFIIEVSGVTAISIGVGRFAITKLFEFAQARYKSKLDADLEKYKNALVNETELFKSGLNLANAEQGIRFTKLHERRAEIIERLHELLMVLQNDLKKLTSLYQGPEWHSDSSKQVTARNSIIALTDYYNKSRIFLPVPTCKLVEDLKGKSLDVIGDFFEIQVKMGDVINSDPTGSIHQEIITRWQAIDSVVDSQINQVRVSLENTFRVILGDPDTTGTSQLANQLAWNKKS